MGRIPEQVEKLVETFDRNIGQYKSGIYNETEVRIEFINPLWKSLGWDMDNESGYAMPYRDVIHEDAIKVGGATKAPDYCFRIGGMRKFFLEAKKPAVNVKMDISPAFQLRRYAWSCKLPLSILTDFEEMAVYDCTGRPKKNDKASVGRIKYYTFADYVGKWDEIESIFSREAILKGSFDKFAKSKKGKRGTTEVDSEFLREIEGWREILAKSIALRNPKLSVRELNFSVQKTIDRIIFLRMCEDKGIEPYQQLQKLCSKPKIYTRMLDIYRKADEKYNSGLFHFHEERDREGSPDSLTPRLDIDDKTLKSILAGLYFPDCPYEFSILPSEILGNVYEQFLGKVIHLTSGHRAKIEKKPEVRKAGGVYYTPRHIVDYIVQNTVGKLCEGKTIKQAAELRVLDPACGSGSFLLGAYQYLLNWHLEQYQAVLKDSGKIPTVLPAKGKRKKKTDSPAIYQGREDAWMLTTSEKKRILLNNIYGVDIDSQAVEVTKLSLLLKVLEHENQQSMEVNLKLWHERALPDLSSNIKCGNSLIGPDFYQQEGQQSLFADEETRYRINAFDWHDEKYGFGEIMKAGGFDAVIGNPPYGGLLSENEANHINSTYSHQQYSLDTYLLFFEKGMLLNREAGYWAMIIPNTWLLNLQTDRMRRYVDRAQQN